MVRLAVLEVVETRQWPILVFCFICGTRSLVGRQVHRYKSCFMNHVASIHAPSNVISCSVCISGRCVAFMTPAILVKMPFLWDCNFFGVRLRAV